MSEEEKEAIEKVEAFKDTLKVMADNNQLNKDSVERITKDIEIVLSLIDKQ